MTQEFEPIMEGPEPPLSRGDFRRVLANPTLRRKLLDETPVTVPAKPHSAIKARRKRERQNRKRR